MDERPRSYDLLLFMTMTDDTIDDEIGNDVYVDGDDVHSDDDDDDLTVSSGYFDDI